MKLTSVNMQKFNSSRNSNLVNIADANLSVEKNEDTAAWLVESLHGLTPVIAEEAGERRPATASTAILIFTLQPDEMQAVKNEFGAEIFNTPTVTILRGAASETSIMLDLNEMAAVRMLVEDAGLPPTLAAQARTQANLDQLLKFLELKTEEQQTAFSGAHAQLTVIEDIPGRACALDKTRILYEFEALKHLRAKLKEIQELGLATFIWRQYLSAKLPTCLYFDQ
jgi:hypothetical protein